MRVVMKRVSLIFLLILLFIGMGQMLLPQKAGAADVTGKVTSGFNTYW